MRARAPCMFKNTFPWLLCMCLCVREWVLLCMCIPTISTAVSTHSTISAFLLLTIKMNKLHFSFFLFFFSSHSRQKLKIASRVRKKRKTIYSPSFRLDDYSFTLVMDNKNCAFNNICWYSIFSSVAFSSINDQPTDFLENSNSIFWFEDVVICSFFEKRDESDAWIFLQKI